MPKLISKPMSPNKIILRLIISFIAFIFLMCTIFLIYQYLHPENATWATVTLDGQVLEEIDLSAVTESYTFKIETNDGHYNIIEVEPGAIGVIDADCPDKICQNMGMISTTGNPISCLPHKLIIELSKENPSENDFDAVTQ